MAGRPKKVVEEKDTEQKKVESVKVKKENDSLDLLKKENEDLKDKLSQLEQQMQILIMNAQAESEKVDEEIALDDEDGYKEISPMKPIKVISLFNGGVNLSTGGDSSSAKYFRFDKFGTTKVLTYQDLQDVITNNRTFIEEGYVYICDKDVVRNNYLEDAYKKFLTVETINNILSFKEEEIRDMISNTTTAIQETVISILVDKINKGEYVNRNKVAVVGDSVNDPCDIFNLALQMSAK